MKPKGSTKKINRTLLKLLNCPHQDNLEIRVAQWEGTVNHIHIVSSSDLEEDSDLEAEFEELAKEARF